jgi:RHS repeat-associated protein
VDYQKDQPDALHHRYTYDADNRITEVETSADAQNWHHDARYFYYPHGPLQRVELGEHLVQGTDYAYTLQGWLKGINGDRLNPTTDMGRDGDATVVGNPNLLTGRDAYALSLGYYGDNDYKAIASSYDSDSPANIAQRPFAPIGGGGTMNTEHTPLYNGNIAHTVNTLQHFGLWDATNGDQGQVLAMVYRYDQLNRLRTARGLVGLGNTNTWDGVADAATNRYRSEYTYDANGNIETAQRWNATGAARYDSLHYHYHDAGGRRLRNRLYHLQDLAADGIVTAPDPDDLKKTTLAFDTNPVTLNTNASTNNYRYDALGNLVRDNREGITNIEWTVAGKVRSVAKATGPSLAFAYGASGQRTQKQVGDPALDPTAYREHYIRDAQGNIMATYRYTNNTGASLKLNERPVYGSSRLGSLRTEVELHTLSSFDPATANPVQMVDLNYELTDHLGNVCAVVTGRLLDGNGGGTAKQAELVSAQGYEPFGSLLPGRNYNSNSYNFGFNGKPKDDEVHDATGTSYDFGARMYDTRVGRFLSVDPKAASYPSMTPYCLAGNNPVKLVDENGEGPIDPRTGKHSYTTLLSIDNYKLLLHYTSRTKPAPPSYTYDGSLYRTARVADFGDAVARLKGYDETGNDRKLRSVTLNRPYNLTFTVGEQKFTHDMSSELWSLNLSSGYRGLMSAAETGNYALAEKNSSAGTFSITQVQDGVMTSVADFHPLGTQDEHGREQFYLRTLTEFRTEEVKDDQGNITSYRTTTITWTFDSNGNYEHGQWSTSIVDAKEWGK